MRRQHRRLLYLWLDGANGASTIVRRQKKLCGVLGENHEATSDVLSVALDIEMGNQSYGSNLIMSRSFAVLTKLV